MESLAEWHKRGVASDRTELAFEVFCPPAVEGERAEFVVAVKLGNLECNDFGIERPGAAGQQTALLHPRGIRRLVRVLAEVTRQPEKRNTSIASPSPSVKIKTSAVRSRLAPRSSAA